MLGVKVGHYRIVDILGEGGMGIVYKALDVTLERFVALKILNSQALNNPQFVERFKREAKNQAKLYHPNIVPVFGFTEENNVLGIAMEYVEGETLEHFIEQKGRLSVAEALTILRQILLGAAYAHSKGFVHRDIKPSNIIINLEGVAKIMDFGISKSLNDTRGITRTGAKLGTILYMSPEQIKALEPTSQSDIYSIGITFYEMLCGKNPFDIGNDYQIMEAHLKMNPPRLSTMIGNYGQEIDDMIARALNKSLKKRYLTCEEFLADVDALLDRIETTKTKVRTKTRDVPLRTGTETRRQLFKFKSFKKAKPYLMGFLFIVMICGLLLFIYDAVSGLWKPGSPSADKTQTALESYKLNPAYMAKTKWHLANSSTLNQLNAAAFVNDSLGYACGLKGTLLKTTDAGNTWINLIDTTSVFSKINFYDIYFNSSRTGYIAGDNGRLLSLNPGSGELKTIDSSNTESLFDIYFLPDNYTGFITGAGGIILKTNDGGVNWFRIPSPVKKLLYKIFFVNNKKGFIAGWDGTILTTTDGGENWTSQKRISDKYMRGLCFIDNETGYAAGGGGEIYRTDNSGEDWEPVKSGVISGLYNVFFFDKNNGVILGSKGEILVTKDGGESWSATSSGQFAGLTNLTVTPSGKIFITGQNGVLLTK